MVANLLSLTVESQILQGAPTGTYNLSSGPKAMYFQPLTQQELLKLKERLQQLI